MKKWLALAGMLLFPMVAWAQGTSVNPVPGSLWTYLGATYGAAWMPPGGFVPPMSFIDTQTGPLTVDYATVTIASHSGIGNTGLYALPQYSGLVSRVDMTPGSTVQAASGISSYVVDRNPNPAGNESGNAAAYTGITSAAVSGARTWGINTVNNSTNPAGTGVIMSGYEADFGAASPNDAIRGIGLYGNTNVAFAPTTDVRAIDIGPLSTQSVGLARWKIGVLCNVASIEPTGVCLDIEPNEVSGNNIGGPNVAWFYRDGAGARHYYSVHAESNQLIFDGDVHTGTYGVNFNIPSRHIDLISLIPNAVSGTSINSPPLNFFYFDNSSAFRYFSIHAAGAAGTLVIDNNLHTNSTIQVFPSMRHDGAVTMPVLLGAGNGAGPGTPLCINSSTGLVYRSLGTTC